MTSVEPHSRSITQLSKSAKWRKDSQKRFGTCNGGLNAEDKFWHSDDGRWRMPVRK